jgi:hypothetical protein
MQAGNSDSKLIDAAGIVGAATALVTGVGALTLTGTLGRVQRNHGEWFIGSIGAVVVGAGLGLFATLVITNLSVRKVLQGAAVLLAVCGVAVGFAVAVGTADDVERPSLAITLDEGKLAVTGKAEVGNLSSNERLVVFVDGLVPGRDGYRTVSRLYQTYAGPDSDGNAAAEIDVQVPPGRFVAIGVKAFTGKNASKCDRSAPGLNAPVTGYRVPGEIGTQHKTAVATPVAQLADEPEDRDPGCVIVVLPGRPYRPQLTATWEPTDRWPSSVKVTVKASDVGVGTMKDALIAVQVVARRSGDRRQIALYRTFIEPHSRGATARRLLVPLDANARTVCADARYVAPGDRLPRARCPIGKNQPPPVAAVQLRIPADALMPRAIAEP